MNVSTQNISTLSFRLFSRMVFVALIILVGCGDDDKEKVASASGAEVSSGGEASRPLTQPPGSVDPKEGDDGSWDGDGSSNGGGDGSESATQTPEAPKNTENNEPPKASPWGETRAEQCKPPKLKEMSGAARSKVQSGLQSAKSGQIAAAKQAFEGALSSDPQAYAAHFNLGVIADREGKESLALEYYQRALQARPDYAPAARGMTRVYNRKGRPADAVTFIEANARRYPTALDLQAAFAEALVLVGRYDDAWNAARRALRCNERHVPSLKAVVKASLRQGRKELAKSVLSQALSIDDQDAELHFIQAKLYMELPGYSRQVREELEKAVKIAPSFADARMALGLEYLSGGNYAGAQREFEASIKLVPNSVAAHLNLADTYRSLSQWKKATDTFARVLKMDPNSVEAYFNLGLLYMTAKADYPNLDEIQALEKAIEHFTRYRDLMGPKMHKEDPVKQYLTDLERQVERAKRRRDRERRRKEREAAAAAEGES